MRKMMKLLVCSCLCLLLLTTMIAYADFTTKVDNKGLPYDEPDKYVYFVKDKGSYINDNQLIAKYEVHVRDAENSRILSLDEVEVVIDNIATADNVDTSATYSVEYTLAGQTYNPDIEIQSRYNVSISDTSLSYYKGTWESIIENFSNDGWDISETQFGKYKAFRNNDAQTINMDADSDYFSMSEGNSYYVLIDDVKLPDGCFVMSISYGCDSRTKNVDWEEPAHEEIKGYVKSHFQSSKQAAEAIFNKNSALKVTVNKTAEVRTYEDDKSKWNTLVNTDASTETGDQEVAIPAAIVFGGLSAIAAIGAAGVASAAGISGGTAASASGDNHSSNEKHNSSFKMVINKDFGDSIRYNEQPVFISARIIEVTANGQEVNRLDLTNRIRIFSEDSHIVVGQTGMLAESVAASIEAEATSLNDAPSTGIVSFGYSGAGGTFRNNVKFRLIGEPVIEFDGKHNDQLYIPSGSKQTYSLVVKPIDFVKPAKLRIGTVSANMPFDVKLEQSKNGQWQLIVTDQSEQPEQIEKFYENFNVEVIGENDLEKAHSIANLILCHEGLLANFVDGKKEVKGYKDRKTDLMAETIVDFRLGLYDEKQETLIFETPEDLAFTYSDEAGICEIIGLEAELDKEWNERNAIRYYLRAKKPFPSNSDYQGDFSAMCRFNDEFYEYNAPVPLKPDVQIYNEMVEVEEAYQNCVYMIKSYLPADKSEKLLTELNKKRKKFKYGARDYQIFRQFVWNRAQYYIMTEHRDYMRKSAFYDDMIAICEWAKWVGDIAFDMALMPFGGPLAAFVLTNGKNLLIAVTDIYITKGTLELDDVVQYLIGVLGGLDGVVSTTPSPTEFKKLALWLMAFFAYRVVYHRAFSSDNGKRIDSWYDAIGMGFKDLALKGLLASFGSLVMGGADDTLSVKTGKNTRLTYNKYADDDLMKPMTDIGDSVIDGVNSQLDLWLGKLYQFLDDVVDGKIVL